MILISTDIFNMDKMVLCPCYLIHVHLRNSVSDNLLDYLILSIMFGLSLPKD